MTIFGDQAPSVRRPADFLAPVPPTDEATPGAHPQPTELRLQLVSKRAERLQRDAPVPFLGDSSYDPSTGTIRIGESRGGDQPQPMYWHLHSPAGHVKHGLIIGDPERGKSNVLHLITYEAAVSEVFFVVPADPRNENGVSRTWRDLPDQSWISTNVPDTINNLDRLTNIIRSRQRRRHVGRPTADSPGILMAIDDADDVLDDPYAAARTVEILRSGHLVGVGLVLVIRDPATFAAHREVGRLLIDSGTVFVMTDLAVIDDIRATCTEPRQATASAAPTTFIVHWTPRHIRLSLLVAVMTNNTESPDAACEWADQLLSSIGAPPLGWDTVAGDTRSWWTSDFRARRWFLRRHTDCWALLGTVADHSMPGPRTQHAAIVWANKIASARFHVPSLRWIPGPTTGEPGLKALYADTPEEPAPKPGPTPIDLMPWLY